MQKTVDYSFARPSPQSIVDAGYVGVERYICKVNNSTKRKIITTDEVARLQEVGLSITLVFESGEQRAANSGYNGGVTDAQIGIEMALNLGLPAGCGIYYVLEDPTRIPVSQWPAAKAYAQGVLDQGGPYRQGGYGGQDLLESCVDDGLIKLGWQVGGWSRSISPQCHLIQKVGYVLNDTCDENFCIQADWGQWDVNSPIPQPPTPQPSQPTEEDTLIGYYMIKPSSMWGNPKAPTPAEAQVFIAGVNFEPQPVAAFRDAPQQARDLGITLIEEPPGWAGKVTIEDGNHDRRNVWSVGAGRRFNLPWG